MAVSSLDIAAGIAGMVRRRRALVVRAFDIGAATVAWPLALLLRQDLSLDLRLPELLLCDLLVVAVLAVLVLEASGVHRAFWRFATASDLATVALGSVLLALSVTSVLFLIDRLQSVPRSVPVLFALITLVLLAGARIGWMLLARRPGAAASAPALPATLFRPVLLVGAGEGAALAVQLLRHGGGPAYRPVAVLDEEASLGRAVMGVPVVGRLDDLGSALARLQVQGLRPVRLLVTAPPSSFPADALRRLRERAYAERLPVDFLADLVRLRWLPEKLPPEPEPVPPAAAQSRGALVYALAKRAIDTLVAGAVLSLGSPLLLTLGLLVGLLVGRPALFAQIRRGRALVPFTLYKFRTLADPIGPDGRMLADHERQNGLGRFLRRSRLDELPQFWNVLVGDMSIVGPRPLLQSELAELEDGGRARARVRPGITGWAQVNGGQLLSLREKEALDLWYIHHASLWLDLRILWLTALMMVRGERVNTAEVERALCARVPERAMAVAGVRP